jgi:hypothetical protein
MIRRRCCRFAADAISMPGDYADSPLLTPSADFSYFAAAHY